jgi:hypothetical protein
MPVIKHCGSPLGNLLAGAHTLVQVVRVDNDGVCAVVREPAEIGQENLSAVLCSVSLPRLCRSAIDDVRLPTDRTKFNPWVIFT